METNNTKLTEELLRQVENICQKFKEENPNASKREIFDFVMKNLPEEIPYTYTYTYTYLIKTHSYRNTKLIKSHISSLFQNAQKSRIPDSPSSPKKDIPVEVEAKDEPVEPVEPVVHENPSRQSSIPSTDVSSISAISDEILVCLGELDHKEIYGKYFQNKEQESSLSVEITPTISHSETKGITQDTVSNAVETNSEASESVSDKDDRKKLTFGECIKRLETNQLLKFSTSRQTILDILHGRTYADELSDDRIMEMYAQLLKQYPACAPVFKNFIFSHRKNLQKYSSFKFSPSVLRNPGEVKAVTPCLTEEEAEEENPFG